MDAQKAAAAAASSKERKRLEEQDIARLYGTGNLKSKVLHYLRLRNVPRVQEVEIATDLHASHGSISRVVYELFASGLIVVLTTSFGPI